ncbi:MAG: hypothetical protein WCQ76_06785 [Fusobacterium sp.]
MLTKKQYEILNELNKEQEKELEKNKNLSFYDPKNDYPLNIKFVYETLFSYKSYDKNRNYIENNNSEEIESYLLKLDLLQYILDDYFIDQKTNMKISFYKIRQIGIQNIEEYERETQAKLILPQIAIDSSNQANTISKDALKRSTKNFYISTGISIIVTIISCVALFVSCS